MELSTVGKRGTVVIPAALRKRYGIEEGTLVGADATDEGILLRPALVVPVEVYSPERKARFRLENAVDAADYARGALIVREELGVDPDAQAIEPPSRG
ncbi:MAG: AbrB/MazE/SpoVT family DNA-binding domain-containing protein [Thermomicrobium sp.]|nr:AbrB/MazE/SpoVT family DNA-binding domain-containing protein [Thermomicrobium sp.]MDW8058459.1 AbrB/MazE/SpoVT family DNA-binding domain-containing protein [Thermomicrobium sp.]